jgi:hypothetical protein
MRLLTAISLLLIVAGSSSYAQSGTDVGSTSQPQSPAKSSPLNGNWNIAGNRKKDQFPLLSLYIQVNGIQVIAHGDVQVRCPNSPRDGAGGKGGAVTGEIGPDGSFSLRSIPGNTIQEEIRGRVPEEGAEAWNGEYTLIWPPSRNCPGYQETRSFTATPLAPLNGTFSGSLAMTFFEPPPPTYTGPKHYEAKFTLTVAQGAVESNRLNAGDVYFYIPLTGKIQVKGSPCFSHGTADPRTESTHGAAPSAYSLLEGDWVILRFTMNDESQLTVYAVFADPDESALLVSDARVAGGKCDKQSFRGTLDPVKR